MSRSKHTPGPWNHRQEFNALRDEIGVRGKAICTVWVRKQVGVLRDEQQVVADEEGEANARLIAAAPDLLEALKAIHSEAASEFGTYEFSALGKMVAAAIAKAEGRATDAAD